MSKRARDGSLKLRFPIPDKELAGKRNILYYAAGFIMETYNFNPKANLVECRAAVEEGWRAFGMATFPDCIGDMMEEVRVTLPSLDQRVQEQTDSLYLSCKRHASSACGPTLLCSTPCMLI